MKPIEFHGVNRVLGQSQDEYNNLPVYVAEDACGSVVCLWSLTLKERIKLLFSGTIWHTTSTFGGLYMPIHMSLESPLRHKTDTEEKKS